MRTTTRNPRDWTMTVSDHGNGRMLVEVREDGRLTLRRQFTSDDVACTSALAGIVSDALSDEWNRSEASRR